MVAPAFWSVPDEFDPERTLGPEVGAIATLAGFPPDVEQQYCLDVEFALDRAGRRLTFDNTVIAPRQNLKTGLLKCRGLGKLFVLQRPLIIWSAHEFDTARRALLDLETLIEGSDTLRRRVQLTSRGKVATHGAVPEIKLLPQYGGSTLAFKTRTSGGARGLSGDDLFIDEAYAAQADQMGAVQPILLARPGSQMDFASSACRPESAYLWSLVQRGRRGNAGQRSFYIEWCAPPPEEACDKGKDCTHRRDEQGCGCDKPEIIILTHPAVTRGRIELESVMDLRNTMPEDEYPREIMGWHDEPDELIDVLPNWDECRLTERVDPPRPLAVGIAVDRAQEWAAIGVAGKWDDGTAHIGIASDVDGQVDHAPGTGWTVARAKHLQDTYSCRVFIDSKCPDQSLAKALRRAGVAVEELDTEQMCDAASGLFNDVRDEAVTHFGDPETNDAMKAATRRQVGTRWLWGEKSGEITALEAPTIARWGALQEVDVWEAWT